MAKDNALDQRKENKEQKQTKLINRTDWWFARGGQRRVGQVGQKVQTSSYRKINKSWGCNVQHGETIVNNCTVYVKVAKKGDLKSSHLRKNICNYVWW